MVESAEIARTEKDGRIHIKFPYSLKGLFKSTFRSAQWHPATKEWSVSTRSRKRLDAWIAEVEASGALMSAEEHDAIALEEKDLENLRQDLSVIETSLRRALEEKAGLDALTAEREAVLEQLAARKDELDKARDELQAARKEAAAAKERIEERVRELCDFNALVYYRNIMRRHANGAFSAKGREAFDEAGEKLKAERDKLFDQGIVSDSLEELIVANYNRKHKDYDDWFVALEFYVDDESEREEED